MIGFASRSHRWALAMISESLTRSLRSDPWPVRCIPHVPEMLPDELLYSWLGRLSSSNALYGTKAFMAWLFGNGNVIPCIDLPSGLKRLSSVLGADAPLGSLEEYVEIATLYPYHRPFLIPARHDAALRILTEGGASGLKTLIGRVANRFGASPPLRVCAECFDEDAALYGEPYWHRSHQLPGVSCCTKHRIELMDQALPAMATDRQRFIRPMLSTHTLRPAEIEAWRFAVLAQDLLQARLPAFDPCRRRSAYLHGLERWQWCDQKCRIDYRAISTALKRAYDGFQWSVHRDRLLAAGEHSNLGWLPALINRPFVSVHPICHLLLIGLLYGSIEAFVSAVKSCEEGTVVRRRSDVSRVPAAPRGSPSIDVDAVLRDTSLSCRKAAHNLQLSVTTVVLRRRALGVSISERRKWLDRKKIQSIAFELVAGERRDDVARHHHVSVSTVNRIHVGYPELAKRDPTVADRERTQRRACWTKAASAYGIKTARGHAGASYAWLYRHDRDWLLKYNRIRHRVARRSSRVNWKERERRLLMRLNDAFERLMSDPQRHRITRTTLVRGLGGDNVSAHLDQMPMLRAQLNTLSESLEEYQVFRIDRAVCALSSSGQIANLWRVQRASGIKRWTPQLRAYAMEVLARTGNNMGRI